VQPFAADLAGTPQIDSPAFWAQPFRVPASSDPDTATAQTILIMCGHVRKAAGDPVVQYRAADAASQFRGLAGTRDDARAVAAAAWWWCKTYLKFVHHEFIIRQRLGESGHLQGLISPEVLVRMEKPEGDCAIFSECIAAFLTVFGIPYEFVTVAANPSETDVFSHVYLYAVLPDGSRLPLDASHGQYPGWQVPSAHVTRRQVWDSDGNPVADRGSRFDGLHNYGLRGLGEYDESGAWVDTAASTDPYLQPGGTTYDLGPGYFGTTPPAGSITAPSQTSSQWGVFASSLAKMGFDLAKINAIQPGTVVAADGSILRQNPGYAVGSPTVAANLGISTTTLMIGGVALLAVVFMFSGKGR
jgi:hypothetical protein